MQRSSKKVFSITYRQKGSILTFKSGLFDT